MNAATFARSLIRRAGFEPPTRIDGGMVVVAAELFSDGDFLRLSKRGPSLVMYVGRMPKIVVERDLPAKSVNFEIARMVARIELQRLGKWTTKAEDRVARYLTVESMGSDWLPVAEGRWA